MRVTCVIDNCVARGSSLWAEHGLALLVSSDDSTLLWDTGGSGDVLLHNLREMRIPFGAIDAVALSHAHHDHTGGLATLLEQASDLTVHLHPAAFEPRYSMRPERKGNIGMTLTEEVLLEAATLRRHLEPAEVIPSVYVTGSVQPRPCPTGASAHHRVIRERREVSDPYIDDMSLVLDTPTGIVLACGCCHAGLRNTLAFVEAQWDGPIRAIVGGTHLATAEDKELDAVVRALERIGCPEMYLNHCTGERAIMRLARAWPDRVHRLPAGAEISF